MTAAQKALDALSVTPDRRWTPATWTSHYGEAHRAEGPIRATGNAAHDDAERMCLSVNLAAPLAAVVRAVADRPWWVTKWSHRAMCDERVCIECGSKSHKGRPRGECSYIAADVALDAFAVAAQEMFP